GLSSDFMGAFAGESSKSTPLDNLTGRMERDEFDLIAVGRAMISNPDWVQRVHQGQMDKLEDFSASDLQDLV
ncbi:12-oxophytodienoate reductase, partial [Candidatus Entotheonella serta]